MRVLHEARLRRDLPRRCVPLSTFVILRANLGGLMNDFDRLSHDRQRQQVGNF